MKMFGTQRSWINSRFTGRKQGKNNKSVVMSNRVKTSPVPLQLSLSSTFRTHTRIAQLASSTFLNRKVKYKPAGQPRLKWAKLAEKGKNKR